MAPIRAFRGDNLSTQPLADYFWIAGLDGQELLETYRSQTASLNHVAPYDDNASRSPVLSLQDEPLTEEANPRTPPLESPTLETRKSRPNSYFRLSKLSDEARRSIQSIDSIAKLNSNRSSATIKPLNNSNPNSPALITSTAIKDADFEKALKKFAADRDSFFLNLEIKSENHAASPAKAKAKTQRIVAEELDAVPNRSVGSVRRHMSFRDMNSSRRRDPATPKRLSNRASRRMSTYNSVIPQPEHIHSTPNEHPLKRGFEPVLLDRYPRPDMKDELKRRNPFPDYVPMFAFPNDIQIISSDTRPAATWHEFSMTAADNSKIPAVCVVVWIPMKREIADELEKLCDQWRRANLTDVEREMAASLGERLAIERAKLSKLLSKLPHYPQGSTEREDLEEDISAVEEKINLMSEMLRPLRHGAANRIEGLTDADSTGLWIPRAYGILGRDNSMAALWKEWLKAVTVPMMDASVLRVSASSPKVGMWQPLERYVFNICCEAQLPASSKVQVEISVRDLRLYVKKEATNELPGCRSTDLYSLFRTLTLPNIVVLFEYMLSEARIILVSSHVAMLKLASKAMVQLLWPFEWAGVYIPVLPARLAQVLDAPCPYICGVQRKGDHLKLPGDDYVLVDLDKNEIHATEQPPPIPKQQRRKLMSLLHLAAPHHHSRGVPVGPPETALRAFPNGAFSSEHSSLFSAAVPPSNLAKLASLSSSMFGPPAATDNLPRLPVLNAFPQSGTSRGRDRSTTYTTLRQPSRAGSDCVSPMTANFPPMPPTQISRHDSGYALQTSLREKRSGHFDSFSRSDTFSNMRRKASLPFVKHSQSASTVSVVPSRDGGSMYAYAPSSYAQSTLAASTIMPGMTIQPAQNTETQMWVEGHCLLWQSSSSPSPCILCEEQIENSCYSCASCGLNVHAQCAMQVSIVCQAAFYPDQVRAAFARFFTSLLYLYKKFTCPINMALDRSSKKYKINIEAWVRSLSPEHGSYIEMLRQTQAFNEFIAEREHASTLDTSSVKLFDALLAAKKGRSGRMRSSMVGIGFGRKPFSKPPNAGSMDFLTDTSSHTWRVLSFAVESGRPDLGGAARGRDYRTVVTRIPAKLEDELLEMAERKDVDMNQGSEKTARLRHRMNGLSMHAP